jgi:hypothetical protein
MSSDRKSPSAGTPAITAEIAAELAREAENLRREYRQRVEAMWTISKDERQTRSR